MNAIATFLIYSSVAFNTALTSLIPPEAFALYMATLVEPLIPRVKMEI